MSQATHAAFDAGLGLGEDALIETRTPSIASHGEIRITLHEDIAAIEQEWRAFEQIADGTVFQSFDWLSTWQYHIGSLEGATPVVVTGHDSRGQMLFLLPLSVDSSGFVRRLTWLGTVLCDYNGPLLAPDFSRRVGVARFPQLWEDITIRLRSDTRFRFDVIDLDKMQDTVGAQPNPFVALGVTPHANGAYLTHLNGGDWETFYTNKRSSATRRRDRTKRKKLGEIGEVRFVTPDEGDVLATLDTLMEQKSKAFAVMGVTDIFALPGHRDFYRALASRREFVHVSRLDVGDQVAAANLGMVFGGNYYHLLASYNGGELSKYGPGAAHMHELLRYSIERGCGAFDFTIGDERYKQEWCDKQITLYDHVAAATLQGVPVALRSYLVGRAKRWIKQTPAVWEFVYKLRAFIGPAMRRLRG